MKVSAAENHWGDALSLLSPNQFEPDPDRVAQRADAVGFPIRICGMVRRADFILERAQLFSFSPYFILYMSNPAGFNLRT